ncbi:hypothetical protein VP01_3690g1 [Puccinia sorghi]|uniref:Uncharacterized protein n=1 Tax=Puccinia sorghi TaxID=27349 RepID=A0A0L6UV15_9BASI|nr:hypothetical protein VP01_3690g1 [Puccinia sorghi]
MVCTHLKNSHPEYQTYHVSNVVVYAMYFVAWLFLYCGLSQAKCREVLPPNVNMENKIPMDVHTITKNLKLDPVLVTYVCCHITRKPTHHYVFITQSFQSWLEWFLSLPEIENLIEDEDHITEYCLPSVSQS